MNDTLHTEYESLSSASARRVDAVCDRFEEAWLGGQAPRPEDFLGDVPESERAALRAELALLDRTYRTGPPRAASEAATVSHQAATATTAAHGTVEAGGEPPAAIGKYRVVQRLGGGGQGDVFRAVHPTLGQDVAIKWARQDVSDAAGRQLIDEGRVLARLDDPGVVRVHDVDVHEGRPFVVFAYVAGQSLADHLRHRRLPFRAAAALTADLAAILERVHRQGILHRDLKPANVLLDAAGRPRLMDFGLASLRQPWGGINLPEEEAVCGTYPYMAPEQARGEGERVGPRADVFGLGAILYELLTGQRPYRGRSAAEVREQARAGRVDAPRRVNPRVPRALERICLKALATDPERRYASAAEMGWALRAYLRRPLWLAAAGAAVLLMLAATLAVVWWPREAPGPPSAAGAPVQVRPAVPLAGELRVRVWSPRGQTGKAGLEIGKDFGALPVRNKELVQIEARCNAPAHVYLIWLGSDGAATPLYPWNEDRIRVRQPVAPPPRPPVSEVFSPAGQGQAWTMGGKSGLETILLLARREPLPPHVNLAELIGKGPVTPLRDAQEFAIRSADEGQGVREVNRGQHRGPEAEVAEIDDPLLQLLGRLRPHFEVIRAIRFAHEGGN